MFTTVKVFENTLLNGIVEDSNELKNGKINQKYSSNEEMFFNEMKELNISDTSVDNIFIDDIGDNYIKISKNVGFYISDDGEEDTQIVMIFSK